MDQRPFFMDYMAGHPVVNTHMHHKKAYSHPGCTLAELMADGYLSWCDAKLDDTPSGRAAWLFKVRAKSYFVALEQGLAQLFGRSDRITPDTWDAYDGLVREAHEDPDWQWRVLRDVCRYERVIQDNYDDPGADDGPSGLFAPAYRVNLFAYGFDPARVDHNGNSPLRNYGFATRDLDEYTAFMARKVREMKEKGCAALKSAAAYEHGLNFAEVPRERAQAALRAGEEATPAQEKDFRDYIFFRLCDIAAENRMPFQVHTGLRQMKGTNALSLREVIEAKPNTKFVLFHGGFPWIDDVAGLLHAYDNVYPDLCWLPLLSPTAAALALHQFIEIGQADRLCWGCDTWTSEDSFGALFAARKVIARVMDEKVANGYLTQDDALRLIDDVLYNNAKKLYGL